VVLCAAVMEKEMERFGKGFEKSENNRVSGIGQTAERAVLSAAATVGPVTGHRLNAELTSPST